MSPESFPVVPNMVCVYFFFLCQFMFFPSLDGSIRKGLRPYAYFCEPSFSLLHISDRSFPIMLAWTFIYYGEKRGRKGANEKERCQNLIHEGNFIWHFQILQGGRKKLLGRKFSNFFNIYSTFRSFSKSFREEASQSVSQLPHEEPSLV